MIATKIDRRAEIRRVKTIRKNVLSRTNRALSKNVFKFDYRRVGLRIDGNRQFHRTNIDSYDRGRWWGVSIVFCSRNLNASAVRSATNVNKPII